MKPKISVIVPIYNVEIYLVKCIESIINQTYSNLEIILVDDGSPDNCGEICNYYATKDNRIKVIHKENGGLSDARNVGLDFANGEYINFIDPDDYIHEKFYDTLINLAISHNADIAQCDFLKVYENGSTNTDMALNERISVLNNIEALNNLFNDYYVTTTVVWNKLYRKELFTDIRFPKGKINEDEFTTFKVLFNSEKVVTTSKPLYYYLQRSNSIMGEKFNTKRLDYLEAYSSQISFYNKNKLFDLKTKAVKRLEGSIRYFMNDILKSDIENKEKTFNYLINYYRSNFSLFKNDMGIGSIRRIVIYLFNYCPKFTIKLLCKLLQIKLAHFVKNKYRKLQRVLQSPS
jgi:glycosyltransferase involved in cell wall biosynthesis